MTNIKPAQKLKKFKNVWDGPKISDIKRDMASLSEPVLFTPQISGTAPSSKPVFVPMSVKTADPIGTTLYVRAIDTMGRAKNSPDAMRRITPSDS